MKVRAVDDKGNIYTKDVTLYIREDRWIVSFGAPIEYYLEDLTKDYPYINKDKGLCIDAGGRNHRDIPGVTIPPKEINLLIRWIFSVLDA